MDPQKAIALGVVCMAELKRAQSDLQELKKDLQLERRRRQKLEQLLSEGRK